ALDGGAGPYHATIHECIASGDPQRVPAGVLNGGRIGRDGRRPAAAREEQPSYAREGRGRPQLCLLTRGGGSPAGPCVVVFEVRRGPCRGWELRGVRACH